MLEVDKFTESDMTDAAAYVLDNVTSFRWFRTNNAGVRALRRPSRATRRLEEHISTSSLNTSSLSAGMNDIAKRFITAPIPESDFVRLLTRLIVMARSQFYVLYGSFTNIAMLSHAVKQMPPDVLRDRYFMLINTDETALEDDRETIDMCLGIERITPTYSLRKSYVRQI